MNWIRDRLHNLGRNLRGERSLGRVVTLEDVMIHARPGHKACQGTGAIKHTNRQHMPCACAANRFQRANLDKIEPVLGGLAFAWLEGSENPRAHALAWIGVATAFLAVAAALAVWGVA